MIVSQELLFGLNAMSFPTQDREPRCDCGVSTKDTLISLSPHCHEEEETDPVTEPSKELRDCTPSRIHTWRTTAPSGVSRQPDFRSGIDYAACSVGPRPAFLSRRGAFLSAPPIIPLASGGPVFKSHQPYRGHTPNRSVDDAAARACKSSLELVWMLGSRIERSRFLFPTPNVMSKESSNKPWKTLRSAGVSASIFANTASTKEGEVTYFKVSLNRAYRDGDEWKSTASLGRDDLPAAALLLQQAWVAIVNSDYELDD